MSQVFMHNTIFRYF